MTADAVPAGATVKPRLTGGQRVTAALAGIFGFLLISIGWTLILASLSIGGLGNLLAVSLRNGSTGGDAEANERTARALSDALNVGAAPLIAAGVIGAVLLILGLFVSRGILRRGGHYRPWGVTWAGLGIAVILSIIVNAIGGIILGAVSQVLITQAVRAGSSGDADQVADVLRPFQTTAAIAGLVALVLVILIGWISWSWMAHALRPTVEKVAARDARARDRIEADQRRLDAESERHARQRAAEEERGRGAVAAPVVADDRERTPRATESAPVAEPVGTADPAAQPGQTAGADAAAEPVRSEPVRSEPVRSEPVRSEPLRSDTDPAVDPARSDAHGSHADDARPVYDAPTEVPGADPHAPTHRAPGEPDSPRP